MDSITARAEAEAKRRLIANCGSPQPEEWWKLVEGSKRTNALIQGFVQGALWHESQRITVTDEMVERAARALMDTGIGSNIGLPYKILLTYELAEQLARAAFQAAGYTVEGEKND